MPNERVPSQHGGERPNLETREQLGPLLLLGAPGVGKGTQAQRLATLYNAPQISTGDLLRQHVQSRSELGLTAKALMDDGKLVPDAIVNQMVEARLSSTDCADGYILDGFPRTVVQAEWLDALLATKKGKLPLIAVQIAVEPTELLQRITGRRLCQACGHIYNLYTKPPVTDGLCDQDGSTLQHRSDDTEQAFTRRMAEFEAKTAPVIDHYRRLGRFRQIAGDGTLLEVEDRLKAALRDLRSPSRKQD